MQGRKVFFIQFIIVIKGKQGVKQGMIELTTPLIYEMEYNNLNTYYLYHFKPSPLDFGIELQNR